MYIRMCCVKIVLEKQNLVQNSSNSNLKFYRNLKRNENNIFKSLPIILKPSNTYPVQIYTTHVAVKRYGSITTFYTQHNDSYHH